MLHRSASGDYSLPFRVGSLRTQRESKEELLFKLKHGQLVADMADNTIEPGDGVTLTRTEGGNSGNRLAWKVEVRPSETTPVRYCGQKF